MDSIKEINDFFDPLLKLFQHEILKISGNPITLFSVVFLIFALGLSFYLGKLARRMCIKILHSRGEAEGLSYSIGIMIQYVVTILGILFSLDNVGISLTALAAFGAIISVGIGFGLQNIAQNFISGIILLLERPVQRGDFITIGDTVGTVEAIAMRATRVMSRDNVTIIVPNSKLISDVVINQSAARTSYRARIALGVAYGSDTELVRSTLVNVATGVEGVLVNPKPKVFFRDFGESSLDFELVIWLESPAPEPSVTSELRFRIDAAFRKAKIEIPFPQRDLNVRSIPKEVKNLMTEENRS